MTELPDWASSELERTWPTLSDEDRCAIIDNRDADLLRRAASQMRGSELDRSLVGGDFTIDGLQDDGYQWHAVAFGTPWNGWATPVVTAETLQNMLDDLAELDDVVIGEIQADDGFLIYGEDPEDNYVIRAGIDDLYHLYKLGWTFLVCR